MLLQQKPIIEQLARRHKRNAFRCGVPALDRYIRKQASQDSRRKVARIFVAALDNPVVIAGFYTLSAASVDLQDLPDKLKKKLPRYPIPVARIGRLAVDERFQGKGLGSYLLSDALNRVVAASEVVAMQAVIVEALDDATLTFYAKYGFRSLASTPLRMYLPLSTFEKMGY